MMPQGLICHSFQELFVLLEILTFSIRFACIISGTIVRAHRAPAVQPTFLLDQVVHCTYLLLENFAHPTAKKETNTKSNFDTPILTR